MTMPPEENEPYVTFPHWLIRSGALSSAEKVLLFVLESHRHLKTKRCDPKIETLAREIRISSRTVKRALARLHDLGLIEIAWGQRSSRYQLAPRPEWRNLLKGQNGPSGKNPVRSNLALHVRSNLAHQTPPHLITEQTVIEELSAAPPPTGTKRSASAPKVRPSAVGAAAAKTSNTISQNADSGPAQALYDALSKAHPQPGLLERARAEIVTILAVNGNVREIAAAIRASHAKWLEYWRELPAEKFRPQLWRWLRDGDWRTPPGEESFAALRKPAHSARLKSRIAEAIDNA